MSDQDRRLTREGVASPTRKQLLEIAEMMGVTVVSPMSISETHLLAILVSELLDRVRRLEGVVNP